MDVLARGASGLLMVAMPLALGAYLVRRFRTGWRLLLIGGAVFVGSQILHIPFNVYLLNPLMARLGFSASAPAGLALAGAAVLAGLSAGVFEEGARWLGYRFWIRKARSWKEGVVFGSGHGGAEALLLGLLSLATLVQLTALRGQDLATVVPPEQLEAARTQVESYWSVPGWMALLAPLERASTLVIQISLSVIVLQALLRPRGGLWLLAAIGWHALVDASAVFLGVTTGVYQGSVTGSVVTEGLVAVLALVSLAFLLRLRPRETAGPEPDAGPAPHVGPLAAAPPRPERLEDSRFTD